MLAFPRIYPWRGTKTYAGMDENRIHMTGSRLYDCIMQTCEHDDDIDDACNGCSAGYNEQSIEKPITFLIMIHSYAINMIFNIIF